MRFLHSLVAFTLTLADISRIASAGYVAELPYIKISESALRDATPLRLSFSAFPADSSTTTAECFSARPASVGLGFLRAEFMNKFFVDKQGLGRIYKDDQL